MKNKTVSVGEAMMRARLAAQLYEADKKENKLWKRPSGKLFRRLKGLYYLVAVYSFMVYLLNELIFLVMNVSDYSLNDAEQIFYRSNSWLVHGLFLLSVTAFALMILKKVKIACCIQMAVSGLLVLQVTQVFVGEYSNQTLLAVLYLVILLNFIVAAALLFMLVADRNRLEKAVNKEYTKIYERYGDPEYDMLTSQQLEEAVLAYETALEKGETPPKTLN